MCASDMPRRARQRGTSLIELMVGIVVALLIGLVAMGMAIGFATTQRQAVGTASVTSSGSSAIEMLRTQALSTGLGFFGSSSFRCEKLNLSHGSNALANGSAFSPLNVTRPKAGLFDTLDVMHATSVYGGAEVSLLHATAATASLKTHLPVSAGQVVLLSPATAGAPCTVRSVTSITAATADTYGQLDFGSSDGDGVYNQYTFTDSPSYGAGDRIALLGTLSGYRYSVTDNALQQTNLIAGSATATLARNVVAFRVQYGAASSSNSRALAAWVNPEAEWATLDSAHLARILAMRVQLLLRSPQPEKPNPRTGMCEATTSAPTLMTGESYPLATDADKCFRYRLVSTVIPLRNITGGLK